MITNDYTPSQSYIDNLLNNIKPILITKLKIRKELVDSIYYDGANKSMLTFKSDDERLWFYFFKETYSVQISVFKPKPIFNFSEHTTDIETSCLISLKYIDFSFSELIYTFSNMNTEVMYCFDIDNNFSRHVRRFGNRFHRNTQIDIQYKTLNDELLLEQVFLDKAFINEGNELWKEIFPECYIAGAYVFNKEDIKTRYSLIEMVSI